MPLGFPAYFFGCRGKYFALWAIYTDGSIYRVMADNLFGYQKSESAVQRTLTPSDLRVMGGRGGQFLRFPPTLGDSGIGIPFVVFAPYRRVQSFKSNDQLNMFTELPPPQFVVALPLPASALKTSYGVSYEPYDVGQGTGSLMRLASGGNRGEALWRQVMDSVKNLSGQIAYSAGESLLQTIIPEAENIGQSIVGTKNPYTEQLFRNVAFREHTFTYTFIPKNERESRIVDNIVQLFKFYMLPAYSSTTGTASVFFDFPYEFQITYSVADTTFTLLPSVLQQFDVDYAGYDVPKFFNPTKADLKQYPAKVTITMVFKEMAILTRDRMAVNPMEGVTRADSPITKDYEAREVVDTLRPGIDATRFRF